MEFYIDFESWHIEADSKDDAYEQAIVKLAAGEYPRICGCDEV